MAFRRTRRGNHARGVALDYVYELRQQGEVVATGHLSFGRELERGDEVPFGADVAIVIDVRHGLGGTPRVILELRQENSV